MQDWWQITDSERLYLECAVSAIVRYYGGNRFSINAVIHYGHEFTNVPIVRAVLWRLGQELL